MNQQSNLNSRHPHQFISQNRQPTTSHTCNNCGKAFRERSLADHMRVCQSHRQQIYQQRARQPQQPVRAQQQRVENPQQRHQQNFSRQNQQRAQYQQFHYQNYQHEDADDSDYDQNDDNDGPCLTYTFSSNQMPANIKIQFDNIFGPNGVFTTSMNQMNSIIQCNMRLQGMQINVNGGFSSSFGGTIIQQQVDEDYDESDEIEEEYSQEQSDESEDPGLDQQQIEELPTQLFPGGIENCVVCMTNYKRGEKLRILHCMHRFHKNCIDEWLLSKAQCPICRFDLK